MIRISTEEPKYPISLLPDHGGRLVTVSSDTISGFLVPTSSVFNPVLSPIFSDYFVNQPKTPPQHCFELAGFSFVILKENPALSFDWREGYEYLIKLSGDLFPNYFSLFNQNNTPSVELISVAEDGVPDLTLTQRESARLKIPMPEILFSPSPEDTREFIKVHEPIFRGFFAYTENSELFYIRQPRINSFRILNEIEIDDNVVDFRLVSLFYSTELLKLNKNYIKYVRDFIKIVWSLSYSFTSSSEAIEMCRREFPEYFVPSKSLSREQRKKHRLRRKFIFDAIKQFGGIS